MTLIAGFKCTDGFVICADSQETVKEKGQEFRVMRKKIAPIKHSDFDLAIAAAGEGPVINGFISTLRKAAKQVTASEIEQVSEWLQHEMKAYFKYMGIRPRKSTSSMRLTIGVRHKSGKCSLWDTEGGLVSDVDDYSLIGVGDHKYEYAVQQLYDPAISIAQAIFLGLYVMTLAERTSNYVKGPVSVIVVRDNGIYPQPPELIKALGDRVQLFAAQFDKLLVACPDTGLAHGVFAAKIKEFVETVVHLRKEYVEESVGHAVDEGLKVTAEFNLVPLGTEVITVNMTPEQAAVQKNSRDNLITALRKDFSHVQERNRIITNLESIKLALQKAFDKYQGQGDGPTQEEQRECLLASGELLQAAVMGPYKLEQSVCDQLNRFRSFELLDLGLGDSIHVQLQLLCVSQILDWIRKPTQSASQMLAGQP